MILFGALNALEPRAIAGRTGVAFMTGTLHAVGSRGVQARIMIFMAFADVALTLVAGTPQADVAIRTLSVCVAQFKPPDPF